MAFRQGHRCGIKADGGHTRHEVGCVGQGDIRPVTRMVNLENRGYHFEQKTSTNFLSNAFHDLGYVLEDTQYYVLISLYCNVARL